MRIVVLHGPNLNALGTREPDVYGHTTLAEIDAMLAREATTLGVDLTCRQYQGEGEIITALHRAPAEGAHGVLINPGAYTHYSYAIADALRCIPIPSVEIHLSNIHGREEFRSRSVTAPACVGIVAGFGAQSYPVALQALFTYLSRKR
ncbi:type II 3-dehydroquinate dehydratase [bacterium]|nr:MAG: type II 3-dehydroquinate dehydratase [bacterium]